MAGIGNFGAQASYQPGDAVWVEVRGYKNDNKRMMRVLFVDGVPMSAQS